MLVIVHCFGSMAENCQHQCKSVVVDRTDPQKGCPYNKTHGRQIPDVYRQSSEITHTHTYTVDVNVLPV